MGCSPTASNYSHSSTCSEQKEGHCPMMLRYNPKNCTLSKDMMAKIGKLNYTQQFMDLLLWRGGLLKLKPSRINKKLRDDFVKYCEVVEVLVLDPTCGGLKDVFTRASNNGGVSISFLQIHCIFPNVTDIFLRNIPLSLRLAKKIQIYMQESISFKLQRVYFP